MELTLTPDWSIELASEHPTARLAAEELGATLARMGAPKLPVVATATGPRIALRHDDVGDGFMRAPDAAGLLLRGDGPRGLLYAVYDLLEALGWRWPAPGAELIPNHGTVTLPDAAIADRPALPVRSLIIGHDHFLDQAEGWIVWAARNRLNTIFIHTTIHEPALGACRLQSWRARRRTLLPLIHERALRLELGGHHLRDLVPRRLFRDEPTMFRHNGQHRTPDHNFCVSSPRALERIRLAGAAFFRAYPEAEVYHLWPDDLRAGGWCQCPACVALTPADQALLAVNTLAEALPTERPGARVSYLAYHDTEAPPTRVTPHPAVSLIFAPRLRSYADPLGAPANAGVAKRLAGCAAAFRGGDSPERIAVFEYYLDGILFKSAPPPLGGTIAADLSHYSSAQVGAVHVLLTGDRPFVWAPVNAYLFARLAWSPSANAMDLLAEYAAARAPAVAEPLARAYAALEAAWRPALARDPEAATPRSPRGRDPVATPPSDVLDTVHEPRLSAERRLEAMCAAEERLVQGRAALATALAVTPALEAEAAEWELGATLLRFLRLRQQLYVLDGRDASPSILKEALSEAQIALGVMLAWARHYVPPAARPGHLLLRSAFQLQLDHIADRRLLGPWARLELRARRASDLAKLLPGLLR